ncbi:MAG: glycosyltransferase family 39 protein [Aquabacterium sp.]|nr:glycosyltransferase family 39 protein [Aquabacterium sp.]
MLLALAVAAWGTLAQVRQRPVPSFTDCLRGQELSSLRQAAAGNETEQVRFLLGDEAGYLRGADQLARAQVVTDFLGDLLQAARREPLDEALARSSPLYRTAVAFAAAAPVQQPAFVSYRSVLFSALASPWVAQGGCDSSTLLRLRESMVGWRLLLVAASAWLAWQLAARHRGPAAAAVAMLVALDAQLNQAASTFMPDVPGAALALLWLAALAHLVHRPRRWVALGVGLLGAATVLVKLDFLYVVPAALLAAALAGGAERRRQVWPVVGLVVLVHGLVLAGFAARNHAHTGAWFVTSKDTVNLYLGNDDDAPARGYRYGMTAREWQVMEDIPVAHAATARRYGAELALREGLKDRVLELVRDKPWTVLGRVGAKLGIFMTSDGARHFPLLGAASVWASTALMAGGWLGALALWGFGAGAQRAAAAALSASFLLGLAIVCAVCVEVRYLSHLTPMAAVLGACGASAWWARRRVTPPGPHAIGAASAVGAGRG